MAELLERHIGWTVALSVASLLLLAGSLLLVRYFLVTIPPDYFSHDHQPLQLWRHHHPVLRWSLLIGKNLLGTLLLIAGFVMFFTPGQGILTLLLGLSLLDLPGKRALERRIVQRPAVLKVVNLLRAKANRPPLRFHEALPAESAPGG